MTRKLPFVLPLLLAAPLAYAGPLAIGSAIPSADVKMKNVDGKELSLTDVKGASGTLVVFTCNHCPFAKGWESRIVDLGNAYQAKGIGVVAVNANDPSVAAEDGYDGMVARAKEKGFAFPYVDRKSTRLNSSHYGTSRMPSSA